MRTGSSGEDGLGGEWRGAQVLVKRMALEIN